MTSVVVFILHGIFAIKYISIFKPESIHKNDTTNYMFHTEKYLCLILGQIIALTNYSKITYTSDTCNITL